MNKKVSPFHCGSQHADWVCANCDHCDKYDPERPVDDPDACDIDNALTVASLGDGTVSEEIARRMGYRSGTFVYNWPCPECWSEKVVNEFWTRPAPKPKRIQAIKSGLISFVTALKERLLLCIANRIDAKRPDLCRAEIITAALGYGERPTAALFRLWIFKKDFDRSFSKTCKDTDNGPGWCGKCAPEGYWKNAHKGSELTQEWPE